MIRKLVRQMLTAQVFSALTVSLCLLIDSIMIGQFLGEEAMAAYGLANPLLLAIGAIASLLAAGVQVTCSKSLGRGSQKETNEGYSSAVLIAGAVSLVFLIVVLIFRTPFARLLGAGSEGGLFEQTRDYLTGFSIGAPGSMGAMVLVPFLQMAGQSGLLIVSVLVMTVTDVALDLLNVLVFHGGMFGMGLASAVSYYAAMIVAAFYFLSKKSVFRFSPKLVSRRKITELFRNGVPTGFNMAVGVILVFVLNRLLKSTGGSMAVAAYTAAVSVGNAANCICTGVFGVSLTLTGIFYHEEDRTALKELVRLLCRYSVVLGLCMGVMLLIFAPVLISLFIPAEGAARTAAILALRLFAAGLIPSCVNNVFKSAFQATGRIFYNETYSLVEGAVFPLLAAFVFSRFLGLTGVWFWFAVGEALTLLVFTLLVRFRCGALPWQDGAGLLLREDFGAAKDQMLELTIRSMEEVAEASRAAERFCLDRGQDARVSNHIALCIEERAGNTIQHGFSEKGGNLSVRLLHKRGYWVLRFRDDCRDFYPVRYVPTEGKDALGIRLVLAMTEEANYTYSLNLNNLSLKLPETGRSNTEKEKEETT